MTGSGAYYGNRLRFYYGFITVSACLLRGREVQRTNTKMTEAFYHAS